MNFKIEKKIKGSLGRAGVISTKHGEIETPAFVAVGTKAAVKALAPEQVREAGSQVVLANTYHLYLQPGEKIVKKNGGLHKFMNWGGPIMTDSGGFQAFSLGIAYGEGIGKFIGIEKRKVASSATRRGGGKAKVTEEGVEFKSIIDGSKHFLSPEKSIQIQQDLGADIIFALDEFTSPHADHAEIKKTIERTERWAERCLIENNKLSEAKHSPQKVLRSLGSSPVGFFSKQVLPLQALFGIVQGGRYEDLRKESAKKISGLGFEGFGIGGTFVKEDMAAAVRWVNEILPEEKPRHLLGVGEPIDLVLGVENGCDTFDCVTPTRHGRNGTLYTRAGKINVSNSKFKNQNEKLDENCGCYFCNNYTMAYLHHLFNAKEMLAATLGTIHNLYFLNALMAKMRESILENNFARFKEKFLDTYKV